jgi:hypothetical protein
MAGSAVGGLAVALREVVNGHTAAAKAASAEAERLAKSAAAVGTKGDRLLGLPTSD